MLKEFFIATFGHFMSHYNQTPLHRASQNGNLEVMAILLNFPGIDVNRVDHVRSYACHVTSIVAEFLLDAANRCTLFGAERVS